MAQQDGWLESSIHDERVNQALGGIADTLDRYQPDYAVAIIASIVRGLVEEVHSVVRGYYTGREVTAAEEATYNMVFAGLAGIRLAERNREDVPLDNA